MLQRNWVSVGLVLMRRPQPQCLCCSGYVQSRYGQPPGLLQQQQQQQQQQFGMPVLQRGAYAGTPLTMATAVAATTAVAMGGSPVVMFGGIDKSQEALMWVFNLAGFWGNVVRVKFMHKKDNVAMVEYSCAEEAQQCLKLCRGVELFGKPVRPVAASFASVQIAPNDQFARDFSTLKMWRYLKGVHSPNYAQQMCVPGAKLHLAYLHGYTEQELRDVFGKYGRVVAFQFTPDNPTMGYITMSSVGEACTALACCHNRCAWFLSTPPLSCSVTHGLCSLARRPNPHNPSLHALRVSFTTRQ